jgi:hypothetical protein
VLLWMGSLGPIFKYTILPRWDCSLDGDCDGSADADADAGCFVGIAQKGVSIDSVLSHLDQSDDDNVELKIKPKVNSNCKIVKL